MARIATPLTDRKVQSAKPDTKPYRLHDGDGLALLVQPSGVKSWQFRYRIEGKEQTATLGKLDALSLKQARDKADEFRKLADKGEQLTAHKRETKAAAVVAKRIAKGNTFEALAKGWMTREGRRKQWSDDYRAEVKASVDRHLADLLPLPVSSIRAATVHPILDAVEREAPHMAEKVARRLYAIMDHAVIAGAVELNPLPRRKAAKVARRHFPAVTDATGLGAILRDARAADPCKGIQRAHILLAYTAQRVSEVVGATWDEFDLKAGMWSIPRDRMKQHKATERGPHVIPLPPVLLATLREWQAADGDDATMVCPAPRDATKGVTPEGCEKFYRDALKLGGKHSPHSWRSAFSTVCREAGKEGDTIEAQLDHVVGNKVAAAYDRAKRIELRRDLLTWYESTLVAARDGARVLPITGRRA